MTYADEPDAFPYKGDETLAGIARNSCTGTMVYLTATPDVQLTSMVLEGKLEHLFLSKRPHGHELCVPEVRYGSDLMMLLHLIKWIRMELRKEKQLLVFVPRRKTGQLFTRVIKRFIPCCNIDSTTEDKDEIIQQFRDGKYQICVTTSVLERGVTFYDVQVVVWKADNGVFDEAALTQIAGRVGRSPKAPYGDCLFLCNRKQRSVDGCIDRIRKANDD